MTDQTPYFLKYLIATIFCIIASIGFLVTTYKSKSEFSRIDGSVQWVSMKYENLPYRDFLKYRYLKIDSYARPFELFLGKDWGDFTPALDKIDSLSKGDKITVYYDGNAKIDSEPVNRVVYFIDRDTKPVFKFSNSQRQGAWVLIGLSTICLIVVMVYKPKPKINRTPLIKLPRN